MNYFKDLDKAMLQDNERHVMHDLSSKKFSFKERLRRTIKLIGLCQASNLNTK